MSDRLFAAALRLLGAATDLEKNDLARRAGVSRSTLRRLETGEIALTHSRLVEVAGAWELPEGSVEAALAGAAVMVPDEVAGAGTLSRAERRAIERAVAAGAAEIREALFDLVRAERARAARAAAEALSSSFLAAPLPVQRELIDAAPEYRTWAFCERLCLVSSERAANDPPGAAVVADLALRAARRSSGSPAERCALAGFAWGYVGNAHRAGQDLRRAEEAFARARRLWDADGAALADRLEPWRLDDLEASLRRDQRRFDEALALHERALLCVGSAGASVGRLLLKKAFTLEQLGDIDGALQVLDLALPALDEAREPRLAFGARLMRAVNLLHLGRMAEASALLPQVRALAIAQGEELDLLRVLWLEGRLSATKGQTDDALAALRQVREGFAGRGLGGDAALAGLDEAAAALDVGRSAEAAKRLGEALQLFEALSLPRESLAAVQLLTHAVRSGTVTAGTTRQLAVTIGRQLRAAATFNP